MAKAMTFGLGLAHNHGTETGLVLEAKMAVVVVSILETSANG